MKFWQKTYRSDYRHYPWIVINPVLKYNIIHYNTTVSNYGCLLKEIVSHKLTKFITTLFFQIQNPMKESKFSDSKSDGVSGPCYGLRLYDSSINGSYSIYHLTQYLLSMDFNL